MKFLKKNNQNKYISFEKFLFGVVFCWFAYQVIFYSVIIAEHTFPDEPHHIFVGNLWRDAGNFSVTDSVKTYWIGQISRQPYLYHALIGTLYKFIKTDLSPIDFYRSLSVIISLTGFYFSWRFYRETLNSMWARVLAIYFQSCIMMYGFISGAVSYDVLTNAICFIVFWLLFAKRNAFNLRRMLVISSFLFAGCLVKATFLPFAVLGFLALTIIHINKLISPSFWAVNASFFRGNFGIIFLFLGTLGLNVSFYGTNILKYGSIVPECEEVLSNEICSIHYPQSQRANRFQAAAATKERVSFNKFLENYFLDAEDFIFNIQAHKVAIPLKKHEKDPERIILSLSAIGMLWQFLFNRRQFYNRQYLTIALITIAYIATLIYVNYTDYIKYAHLGLGLHGRHWFPVMLGAIYLIWAPIFEGVKKPIQIILFVAGIIGCSKMGFHIFDQKVDPSWFRKGYSMKMFN